MAIRGAALKRLEQERSLRQLTRHQNRKDDALRVLGSSIVDTMSQ
jgi:hypothetical protein